MKKLIILLALILASSGYGADYYRFYEGDSLISLYITVRFSGVEDTSETYDSLTYWDTIFSLTGEGEYVVGYHAIYAGFESNGLQSWSEEINTSKGYSGGLNVDTIYAYDTSGTDAVVTGVTVTVRNLSGSVVHQDDTRSGGYLLFPSMATDTFLISGKKTLYAWDINDTIIITGDQRDTLFGYDISIATSSIANVCAVTVYVFNADGTAAKNREVKWSLEDNVIVDSAGHAIVGTSGSERTDSTGTAVLYLIYSNYLIPATDYKISVGRGYAEEIITVPSQASYTVTFTNQ